MARGNMKNYYVYILASKKEGVLYIGVTSDLIKRIYEHKQSAVDGFSKQYWVKRLVYFEIHSEVEQAITREKQIKKWRRAWKIELIKKQNPYWNDLYEEIIK